MELAVGRVGAIWNAWDVCVGCRMDGVAGGRTKLLAQGHMKRMSGKSIPAALAVRGPSQAFPNRADYSMSPS